MMWHITKDCTKAEWHLTYRSRLMRACEAWLKGESPNEDRREILRPVEISRRWRQ